MPGPTPPHERPSEYTVTSVEIDGKTKWTLFHPIAGALWLEQARDTREEAEAWLAKINERRMQR